ncbi:MAG: hypothetical protein J2P17_24990 [Mycobacterium sp.]|nr:hypothetical protein [Mycobacterium sp.]
MVRGSRGDVLAALGGPDVAEVLTLLVTGHWTGVLMIRTPLAANMSSNEPENSRHGRE